MADTMKYSRGALIGFESGEYSDFRFDGMLVALQDIDLPALAQQYVKERTAEKAAGKLKDYERANDYNEFMGWLVAQQYAAPISYSSVHLGSYTEFNTEFGIPADSDA